MLKIEENTEVPFETVFLRKNPPEDERINHLIYWGKRFHKLGLVPKSTGNLSFRTGKGFIITGTGINLGAIEKEELVEILRVEIEKSQILVYAKGHVVPSKESLLHSQIYALRPEINAVFHVHDQLVLEFADELRVPCTQREQPKGSYEMVKEARELLGLEKDAEHFILKNHGIISMGETLEEAGGLAEYMNKIARKHKGKG